MLTTIARYCPLICNDSAITSTLPRRGFLWNGRNSPTANVVVSMIGPVCSVVFTATADHFLV